MYKVKLTEKEAKAIGERRWLRKFENRWLWGAGIALLIAVGFALSLAIGMPEWASIAGALLFFGTAIFLYGWPIILTTKAGRALAQSLGGEEAELTEKEAQVVGRMRWIKENERRMRRYILGVSGVAFFAFGVSILMSVLGASGWIALGLFLVLITPAFLLLFRWAKLKENGGKAFVQSLKEEK